MQIERLLELHGAKRQAALNMNGRRLRAGMRRHDVVDYLESMLVELHEVACRAKLRKAANLIDKALADVRALH